MPCLHRRADFWPGLRIRLDFTRIRIRPSRKIRIRPSRKIRILTNFDQQNSPCTFFFRHKSQYNCIVILFYNFVQKSDPDPTTFQKPDPDPIKTTGTGRIHVDTGPDPDPIPSFIGNKIIDKPKKELGTDLFENKDFF